jgi:prolyl 4-hydroxylase
MRRVAASSRAKAYGRSNIIYLNEGFEGGETIFFVEPEVVIRPRTGAGLFFQHPIIHEGAMVTSGTKYAVRTDLMYKKTGELTIA